LSRLPVSVLLPFRNARRYIDEALRSIADQTHRDLEVVMVNDGSADGSVDIAMEWCRRDGRFRVTGCRGSGLVDALNTGLAESAGTWVARMDADDVSLPERIQHQLELAASAGPRTVVTCMVRSFPEGEVTRGYRAYEDWLNGLLEHRDIERNIFVESPVPHPTAFYHRDSVLAEGGYAERELPEDYELWLRLWSRGFRFLRVPRVLLRWRDRPDRLSRTHSAYSLTNFYRLKARYLEMVPCMSGKTVYVAGGGQTARRLGKCLQECGFTIEGFLDPCSRRHGSMLRGRPILDPAVVRRGGSIPVVIASRQPGARGAIREFLEDRGLREWEDYVACS